MEKAQVSGEIKITEEVIEDLVAHTAMKAYGVIGIASPTLKDRLMRLVNPRNISRSVKAEFVNGSVLIDLFITVEHGTNIREIVHNLSEQISYTVDKHVKIDIRKVNIHVANIKT